jgi:hypothetical protein
MRRLGSNVLLFLFFFGVPTIVCGIFALLILRAVAQ